MKTITYQPRVLGDSSEPVDSEWWLAVINPDSDDITFEDFNAALSRGLEYCYEMEIEQSRLIVVSITTEIVYSGKES